MRRRASIGIHVLQFRLGYGTAHDLVVSPHIGSDGVELSDRSFVVVLVAFCEQGGGYGRKSALLVMVRNASDASFKDIAGILLWFRYSAH